MTYTVAVKGTRRGEDAVTGEDTRTGRGAVMRTGSRTGEGTGSGEKVSSRRWSRGLDGLMRQVNGIVQRLQIINMQYEWGNT